VRQHPVIADRCAEPSECNEEERQTNHF
jgi:hypothetical protein